MGPLLYTLYTNELPSLIKSIRQVDNLEDSLQKEQGEDHVCCFADDTTMSSLSTHHRDLTTKMTKNYNDISKFMVDNRLKLNNDKSHLLVINSSKRRATANSSNLVEIKTPSESIRPTTNQRLLGCWIQDDLKWTEHIRDNEESLIRSLNKRLNAQKIISKISDFKTRKFIAEGIFMSKLVYMISVWSGCTKELLSSIQTIQNRAAKALTRNN